MYVNSSQCKQNMGTHTSRSVQELIPENEKGDKKRQKYRREEDRKKNTEKIARQKHIFYKIYGLALMLGTFTVHSPQVRPCSAVESGPSEAQ